ncbi:hypothetical protein HID58_019251 [Brassica napus]|uniref:Nudix hydrolase n=2 Tax=Brassica TaxID=3705 RepID=A0ABQ8DEX6_BRANA|nr:hypothetical protein HID58_019251 [Brassica napus]CAG7877220.1 unnamed protein product [Brassica rapa]VDC72267.1 unnamed protein product [Brassica rapa]
MRWRITTGRLRNKSSAPSVIMSSAICWEEGDLDKATSWFIANLVEFAVIGGCRYHQAEPVYLMLVSWISNTPDTIPANASHIVGVGALVLNKTTREAP